METQLECECASVKSLNSLKMVWQLASLFRVFNPLLRGCFVFGEAPRHCGNVLKTTGFSQCALLGDASGRETAEKAAPRKEWATGLLSIPGTGPPRELRGPRDWTRGDLWAGGGGLQNNAACVLTKSLELLFVSSSAEWKWVTNGPADFNRSPRGPSQRIILPSTGAAQHTGVAHCEHLQDTSKPSFPAHIWRPGSRERRPGGSRRREHSPSALSKETSSGRPFWSTHLRAVCLPRFFNP